MYLKRGYKQRYIIECLEKEFPENGTFDNYTLSGLIDYTLSGLVRVMKKLELPREKIKRVDCCDRFEMEWDYPRSYINELGAENKYYLVVLDKNRSPADAIAPFNDFNTFKESCEWIIKYLQKI